MGMIKKKGKGSALERLRRQKDIAKKIERGELRAVSDQEKEALVIVLDRSPSMMVHQDAQAGGTNPWMYAASVGQRAWDAAVRAARALIDASRRSRIGLVVFDAYAPPHARFAVGSGNAVRMLDWLRKFSPENGSGTDFTQALDAALDLLEPCSGHPVRRIVMMTDGCDGKHSGLEAARRMEERLRASRVILDTVGFGDVDENELQRLSRMTGGVYRHAASGEELVREFKQLEAGIRGLLSS